MDSALYTLGAIPSFFGAIASAGYTIQARAGIPDAIGFFSKPGLDLCQLVEGVHFLFLVYSVAGALDAEVRVRLRESTVVSEKEVTGSRGLILRTGNGRFLVVAFGIYYFVALILRAVFLWAHPGYL